LLHINSLGGYPDACTLRQPRPSWFLENTLTQRISTCTARTKRPSEGPAIDSFKKLVEVIFHRIIMTFAALLLIFEFNMQQAGSTKGCTVEFLGGLNYLRATARRPHGPIRLIQHWQTRSTPTQSVAGRGILGRKVIVQYLHLSLNVFQDESTGELPKKQAFFNDKRSNQCPPCKDHKIQS
jgi:hypothetical protein